MKIVVVIIGVASFLRGRDWRRSKPNIDKYLLTGWDNNVEIQTMAVVSPVDNKQDFIDSYKTIKFAEVGSLIQPKYEEASKLMLDVEADAFIITRPDINFLSHVSTWNIDFSKFNFLHKEYPGIIYRTDKYDYGYDYNISADNFFVLPGKYKQQFYEATMLLGSGEGWDFFSTSYEIEYKTKCPMYPGPMNYGYYPFIRKFIGENNIHHIDNRLMVSCTWGNDKYWVLDRTDTPHDIVHQEHHIKYFFSISPQARETPYAKVLFSLYPHLDPRDEIIDPCRCRSCEHLFNN